MSEEFWQRRTPRPYGGRLLTWQLRKKREKVREILRQRELQKNPAGDRESSG